eukprot:CAMPEP_0194373516 /NCGR_PEP_ID=MMETSP0174-20130528/21990_1 /TAXON_ID=216777 /ORGANISM="Proboscia alata, Strain PI-D3" /LENGTH=112 /DNA_ID=CAMNT_0039152659 /DNA_START=702 /DNA_END=1038 /DNA_ORIENTATION=-
MHLVDFGMHHVHRAVLDNADYYDSDENASIQFRFFSWKEDVTFWVDRPTEVLAVIWMLTLPDANGRDTDDCFVDGCDDGCDDDCEWEDALPLGEATDGLCLLPVFFNDEAAA